MEKQEEWVHLPTSRPVNGGEVGSEAERTIRVRGVFSSVEKTPHPLLRSDLPLKGLKGGGKNLRP